jgi:hypothetical protein
MSLLDNIFCGKCGNLFNIKTQSFEEIKQPENTPEVLSTSTSANIDYKIILQKVEAGTILTQEELKTIDIKDLINNDYYKKLTKKGDIKKKIIDMIDDMINSDEKTTAFMVCQNCGYTEPIKHQSCILTKTTESMYATYDYINETLYRNKTFMNTMPRTKDFICVNKSCPAIVSKIQPEAIFIRKNKHTYETIYVCCNCLTIKI